MWLYRHGIFSEVPDATPLNLPAHFENVPGAGAIFGRRRAALSYAGYWYTALHFGDNSPEGADLRIYSRAAGADNKPTAPYPYLAEIYLYLAPDIPDDLIYIADTFSLAQFIREYMPIIKRLNQGSKNAEKYTDEDSEIHQQITEMEQNATPDAQ